MTRADYFASAANAHALQMVEAWPDWPVPRLMLVGPAGAGKTHLAHIWAAMSGARIVAARDLGRMAPMELAASGAVVVEGADRLAGDAGGEAALFHLHNLLATGGALMVTARGPVADWGLTLPDLASRMGAMPVARLDPPDDALLSAVLVKLFADRQVTVQPALISYCLARMERSIAAARVLVAALDARALALGKPISRALAAEYFADDAAGLDRADGA